MAYANNNIITFFFLVEVTKKPKTEVPKVKDRVEKMDMT